MCHIVADDELDAYERGRRLVGFFCQQGHFDRAKAEAGDTDLKALMPASARRAYDVHPIVEALLDKDSHFEEFQSRWAPSIVVGLGRLAGRTVGVIANNPLRLGGCLNSESAEKSARFVRLCDAFGIPLVVVVDVPGYLPGVDQEWGGVVRRGAKLLHAFGEATVPRVTLVTRKIYGGAYIAMNSRSLGATKVFAWPDAEVAVMGAKAAVGILHKRKLAAAADTRRDALHEELAAEHERIAGGVDSAIDIGVVDAKIDPPTPAACSPRPWPRRPHGAVATRTSRCKSPSRTFPAQRRRASFRLEWGPFASARRLSSDEFLGNRFGPLAVGGNQTDAGAPVEDVVDGQRALVGHRVLEFGTRDVDSVGDRLRRPVAGGPGDHVRGLGSVAGHQRGRQIDRRAQRGHRVGRRADQRQVAGAALPGRQPAQRDRPVQHVLGHVPVLGELAADHADDAAGRLDDACSRDTSAVRPAPVSISGRSPA